MPSLTLNWKLTLFTAAFFPLLMLLGFWQLDREQQKIELQQRYEQRRQLPPVAPDEVDWQGDPAFTAVRARGRYDNAHHFLLDNRVNNGRVGYEVITPFATDDGTMLVNRGWIAQGPSRDQLPPIPDVEEPVTIRGRVHVPQGQALVLGDEQEQPADAWPKVIQTLDVPRMATQLDGESVYPYSLRLLEDAPGLLEPAWPAVADFGPERHRGYAVQWFALAAVLLLMFLYASLRPRP